jgi:alanine dehydrogenase
MNSIGLRKEEKAFEGRVPIVPLHAKQLSEEHRIHFVVEPSSQRAFSPEEYKEVGAEVGDLTGPNIRIILGIKEMPLEFFQTDKVYVFFSHTIKGQKYNMPMLQRILDVGATLIDYERVVDEKNRRLIFFGNWAGMAGMAETLRVLGQRLDHEGLSPNPFSGMKPTIECKGLEELKSEFREVGRRIERDGLPESLTPFIIGFAGYGNVSRGAQEMFDLLPHETIEPHQLADVSSQNNLLYKCVFKEEDMVAPIDSTAKFELQDYYQYGATKYRSRFHEYIPYLSVMMNCIYWTKKYPRLVTRDFIKSHWPEPHRKLIVVGDISCDIMGAVEFTVQCTNAGDPAFTYSVTHDEPIPGVDGDGPVVMAVDNLPCELPRESSTSFSSTLLQFIPSLANADFTGTFEELNLPRELKDAIIVYRGKLTKSYAHLATYLEA